jgi:NAD(P)-dependent dehydrogenase (short-subunit alcohol dehydrogenase family)
MKKSQRWTFKDMPDLTGKTAVVSGANSGVGFCACRALAARGAQVVMACRNLEKGQAAADAILKEFPQAALELMALDLADLSSVRAFVFAFGEKHARLHLLINNAGLMATPYRQTADGFELQLGVNYLGHFALTGLLLEQILAAEEARVVTVTSAVYSGGRINFADLNSKQKYARWGAYAQSKLANLLFAGELQRRLERGGYSATSLAAHPGYSATNLQITGPGLDNDRLLLWLMKFGNALFAQPACMGALPVLYAASLPEARGGDLIGPDGLLGLRGYPVRMRPVDVGRDPQVAERLWKVSEELTGVRYERLRSINQPEL